MTEINQEQRRRIHLLFPLVLITTGIVLLWRTVGGHQTDVWSVVLRLWPLLMVYVGIEGFLAQKGAGINTFWVTFGLASLLSNFGRISWSTWEILLSLWPVIIVALGIDLVLGRQSWWSRLAASVLILMVMGGIILFFDMDSADKSSDWTNVEQLRKSATEGNIILEPAVGFLKVFAQGNRDMLAEGRLRLWKGEKYFTDYIVNNGVGTYKLQSSGLVFIYEPGTSNRGGWEVGVSSRMPISLTANQAIGEISMDLTELEVKKIDANLVLGRTLLILPGGTGYNGRLSVTIGEIIIDIPEGAAIRIKGEPTIGSVSVPESFGRQDSFYTSPDYDTDQPHILLEVSLVIGQLVIRQR